MKVKKNSKLFAGLGTAWKSNEFFRAILTLTSFYLLILLGILALFSSILFWYVEHKIATLPHISMAHAEELIVKNFPERTIIKGEFEDGKYSFVFDNAEEIAVDAFTQRILLEKEIRTFQEIFSRDFEELLLMINIGILCVSACLGWFLATKTLQPIRQKIEEQKQFISDSSHELKNPISAISATCESMIRMNQKDGFEEILEESQRLTKITENLLILDQLSKKNKKTSCDIAKIITKMVQHVTPLADKKHIVFETTVENVSVFACQQDIEKIVFNLLHNAIKFSHNEGKIIVSLDAKKVLRIQDSGIGIAEKDMSKIFNRFYKADNSRTFDRESGAGLGLSIVKGLIEKNNWHIEVVSEKNNGTHVTIYF
jgi:signal transduction histidine kinase